MKANLQEWIDRGIENYFPSKEIFLNMLQAKKKYSIYLGVDATGPLLHLGHSTNLFILRKLQDEGHKIIFLVGDFTAMIGDPTDKLSTRQPLSRKEVLKNALTYKKQAGKILNFSGKNPVIIKYNSRWLSKINFSQLINISSHLTVQQLISRDMFQERLKNGKTISLHEFLYPLMQGYDSVAMKVDMEIGGNDQTFNMLVGRDLAKKILKKDKIVLGTKLLINPKTNKKMMNKSEGSFISLLDNRDDMFGKIMSLPDECIMPCFNLCTDLSNDKILEIERKLKFGANPKDIKILLAKEIVKIYHSEKDASLAFENFSHIFSNKEIPYEVATYKPKNKKCEKLIEFLVQSKMASTKNEARRLIIQGAVKIDKEKITDIYDTICFHEGMIFQVGKRKFLKITLK